MDIVKQLNGSVKFIRSGVVVQTLLENVTARLNEKRNGLFIVDTRGLNIEIFTSQIENTQLLPAAQIKFQPGTTVDLWDLLIDPTASPFFVDLRLKFAAGTFDPNAIHDNVSNEINSIAQKLVPIGADELLIEDSAAGYVKKKVLISTLPAAVFVPVVISPPQITANQDDYTPTGWSTADIVRLDLDANRDITGFGSVGGNKIKKIFNLKNNLSLNIKKKHAGSLAANRVLCVDNKDYDLKKNGVVVIIYDDLAGAWRVEGPKH
jgi:hypothetical protein